MGTGHMLHLPAQLRGGLGCMLPAAALCGDAALQRLSATLPID